MNKRAKSDKTCHLVLSFPEGERLSLSDLNAIEERFCDVWVLMVINASA
jgi:hypothetical protein